MHTTGSKRSYSGYPTLTEDGTWQQSRNYEKTGKECQPKALNGLIGHRGRWYSRQQQLLQIRDHNDLSDGIRHIKHRPFSTHGKDLYGKESLPLMEILSGRRWYKARRNNFRHDSTGSIPTLTRHHPCEGFYHTLGTWLVNLAVTS